MDFFQGSSPPNYISFCLENQNLDEAQIQLNTVMGSPAESAQTSLPRSVPNVTQVPVPSPHSFPPNRASFNQAQLFASNSPFSTDSNVDVTAYATKMVQRMELRFVNRVVRP